jgi:hypothetical protein
MSTVNAVAVALVLTCGCSFIATRSTPSKPDNTCSGYLPAIIDSVLTAAMTVVVVKSHLENSCSDLADGCHTLDPTGIYILGGIPFAISTLVGFSNESTCRAKRKPR